MHKKLFIFAIFTAAVCFLNGPSFCFADEGPGKIIVESIDKALGILKDPSLQGMDQYEQRRQTLWIELKPVFNFEETAKRALGRHWLKLTEDEKNKFSDSFTKILRDIYLGKSDSYQGEKIVYVREVVEGNRGKVQTNFFTTDQKKVVVDFSMQNVDNTWKIYDVIIEGVSMVSNYRSQFNSIMSKGSFEELMEKLEEKKQSITSLN